MHTKLFAASLLGLGAIAAPLEGSVEKRSCPSIHIFGARETSVSPGYGSAGTVVNSILSAYPGSTAEAINYPACGGQASCGYLSYSNSVQQGINAVTTAVNRFNSECPNSKIVLVGYSQGSEIFDVNLCGGGDPNQGFNNKAVLLSSSAVNMVKAATRPMVGVVARHPSVTDPPPLVNVHRHTVVAVARPLAAGTEASVARASHAVNQGTEHQTARTSRRRIRSAACLPRCSVRASSASDKRLDKAEHNAKEHRKAGLPCVSICDLHMPDERLAVLDTTTVLCGRRFTEEMIFLARC